MSGGRREMDGPEIYRFPEFFDRLDAAGTLRARDALDAYTELDGLVYHHRGLQVPAYGVGFLTEPDRDAFRVEVNAVGRRSAWASFDRAHEWEIYVMLFDGGAVVTWMSDAEFEAEEADVHASKAEAILSGRFSFGTFFLFGPDWVEREEWARASSAPALLQTETGEVIDPDTAAEFWELQPAIPPEFRTDESADIPEYLGLIDCGLSVETENGDD